MAAGLGLKGHDQLQPFVASPAWDDAPLRRLLLERADTLVGGFDAVLAVDDTALPKQGKHSVGGWRGSTAAASASGRTAKSPRGLSPRPCANG